MWLSTIRTHYLPALLAFNTCMRQNAKWTREKWLPCYCYAIKSSRRTICTQVSQLASAHRQSSGHEWTCVWAAVQTKSTRSSSHLVSLMSGDRRSSGQLGGRRMLQSKIIRLADCSSAPQMHLGVSRMPQRYRHVPKRPTQFLSLFSATHRPRGSSEPDSVSELHTHHCTTPGQWTWFLCAVSVIPPNKLSMQELNQFNRN